MCKCCTGGKHASKYKKFAFLNDHNDSHDHDHHHHDHDHHHHHDGPKSTETVSDTTDGDKKGPSKD